MVKEVETQRELDSTRLKGGDEVHLTGPGPFVFNGLKFTADNPLLVKGISKINGGNFNRKKENVVRKNQALLINNCYGVHIEDVDASAAGHGFRTLGSKWIQYRRCKSHGNLIEGFIHGGCVDILYEDCFSWLNGRDDKGHAFYGSYGSKTTVFRRCYGWDCKGTFIQCNGTPDELPAREMKGVLIENCFGFRCGTSGTPFFNVMSVLNYQIKDTWIISGNAGLAAYNDGKRGADPWQVTITNLIAILPKGKYGLQISPGTKAFNIRGGLIACAPHSPIDGRDADNYPETKWFGPRPRNGGDNIEDFSEVEHLFRSPNFDKPWLGDWTPIDSSLEIGWIPDLSVFKT